MFLESMSECLFILKQWKEKHIFIYFIPSVNKS